MRLLVALAFVTLSLAGCSDSGASDTSADDATFEDFEADVTSDKGLIRGIVVDATINPISGVTVTLVGQGVEKQTNGEGAFVFADLAPGPYFLEASKVGFNGTQTSTVVEAGVAKPDIVRLLIVEDIGSIPYVSELVTKGYHTCATSAFTLCNFLDGILCIAGSCDVLEDYTVMNIPVDRQPTHINSEEVWTSNQILGQNFDFYLETIDKESGSWSHKRSTAGPSPLVHIVDEAAIEGYGFGKTHDLRHRTFPQLEDPTSAVFIDQKFTVYTHLFYNYAPYEGWRFTEDEVPKP